MVERPESLKQLDRYFAAATIAHEYIADLHRGLAALGKDKEQTRQLLSESAAVVLSRMPELTRELRALEVEWDERELLDQRQAEQTLRAIEASFTEIEPEFSKLRDRQDEIAAELRELIDRARRA